VDYCHEHRCLIIGCEPPLKGRIDQIVFVLNLGLSKPSYGETISVFGDLVAGLGCPLDTQRVHQALVGNYSE
jgi:hypothetical protein